MKCEAHTVEGAPCQAPAQTGRPFCFHHDPEKAAARSEARRRGGLRSHGLDPTMPRPEVRLLVVADIMKLLETAGADCLAQKPSLSRARALAYIGGMALKVIEVSELETRIRALEGRLSE